LLHCTWFLEIAHEPACISLGRSKSQSFFNLHDWLDNMFLSTPTTTQEQLVYILRTSNDWTKRVWYYLSVFLQFLYYLWYRGMYRTVIPTQMSAFEQALQDQLSTRTQWGAHGDWRGISIGSFCKSVKSVRDDWGTFKQMEEIRMGIMRGIQNLQRF